MKDYSKILLPLLLLFLSILVMGCQTSKIIIGEAKRKFAPLPPDTPVYFYDYEHGSIDKAKSILVLKAVCISGKKVAGIDSGYYFKADPRPLWDGIGSMDEYEKAYTLGDEQKKAMLEKTYNTFWKSVVPDISYIWIDETGNKQGSPAHIGAVEVSTGEIQYTEPRPSGWDQWHSYAPSWKSKDFPRIADEALKSGSNIVILGYTLPVWQVDEKGKLVTRKVEVSRRLVSTDRRYGPRYGGSSGIYDVSTYDVKYKKEMIFLWWSVTFQQKRLEALVPQKP